MKREPDDGYWTNVWNVQPFSASYWGGRPTQDLRYSTSFVSTADWNDTRFKREDFDSAARQGPLGARPGQAQGALPATLAVMVRDEGGIDPAGVQRLPERLDQAP